jgi:hypothetical protein
VDKYSRLITVANKQFYDGVRPTKPVFMPFAISTAGELGPQAYDLQEWLVQLFRAKCRGTPKRSDGLSSRELVIDYRRRLKSSLQFAMAAGMGQLIAEAGCAAAKR